MRCASRSRARRSRRPHEPRLVGGSGVRGGARRHSAARSLARDAHRARARPLAVGVVVTSPVLDVAAAAQRIGCSQWHVYALVKAKRISHVRLGPHCIRIAIDVIDQYLAAHTVAACLDDRDSMGTTSAGRSGGLGTRKPATASPPAARTTTPRSSGAPNANVERPIRLTYPRGKRPSQSA